MTEINNFFFVGRGEVLFQPVYIDAVVEGFLLGLDKDEAIWKGIYCLR